MLRKLKKAQNTAEYAILIGLIIAAATAMQTYIKRGLQGRIKGGVDYVAKQTQELDTDGTGPHGQYEPYYLRSHFDTRSSRDVQKDESEGGSVSKNISNDTTERSGTQEYLSY